MHFPKSVIAVFAALLSFGFAMPVMKRDVLTVSLKQAGNGVVTAVLTNTGATDVSVLKYGSILDDDAMTRKVGVAKDGSVVTFEGVLKHYKLTGLPEDAFITIPAGESVESTADVASVHNLQAGGVYEVAAAGAMRVAQAGSTELSDDVLTFESNTINIDVDGATASAKFHERAAPLMKRFEELEKRTALVQGSCTSARLNSLRAALTNAASLSRTASTQARSGSATKFSEYYKTTASGTRTTVSNRFNGAVTQASSTSGGGTTYHCDDYYGQCSSNVLAYTYPSLNAVSNCGIYYTALPALTRSCHAQDQATTSLHEFTHAPATYSPGTADNAYGYAASTALSSSRAVLNADTYALYANALYAGC